MTWKKYIRQTLATKPHHVGVGPPRPPLAHPLPFSSLSTPHTLSLYANSPFLSKSLFLFHCLLFRTRKKVLSFAVWDSSIFGNYSVFSINALVFLARRYIFGENLKGKKLAMFGLHLKQYLVKLRFLGFGASVVSWFSSYV
ncbi:hypothetical protein CDL12_24495 [Handroanthus impetiginosus]|uniref:Uncharacterized protein n=1 Tax=Handroanthus impetiginosus TaxID=429701 RepID=A0A2G9GCS1_9LAMI|nr:hypothetical protein CDL12_24495 [Handroanthus impetiginosus]